jgi:HK97 family phage prohead protease
MMQHMTIRFGEIKLADTPAGVMSFSGYGAAFNNVDSYGDVIAPGAFAEFLSQVEQGKEPWPAMLSQHGAAGLTSEDLTPIGVWTKLSEDGKGLITAGDLADTQRGIEMYKLMSMKPRPAIDGLSIGYIAKKWDPRTKPDEPRRTLREIVLMEVSPVTFPANRNARVASVKALEELSKLSEIEDFLREAGGFSRNEAKAIIARIKSSSVEADDLTPITAALTERLKAF